MNGTQSFVIKNHIPTLNNNAFGGGEENEYVASHQTFTPLSHTITNIPSLNDQSNTTSLVTTPTGMSPNNTSNDHGVTIKSDLSQFTTFPNITGLPPVTTTDFANMNGLPPMTYGETTFQGFAAKQQQSEVINNSIMEQKLKISSINNMGHHSMNNGKKSNRGRKKIDRSEFLNVQGMMHCVLISAFSVFTIN